MGNRGSTQFVGHVAFPVLEATGRQAAGHLEDIRLEVAFPNTAFGAALTIPLLDKLDFVISTDGVGVDIKLIDKSVCLTGDNQGNKGKKTASVSNYFLKNRTLQIVTYYLWCICRGRIPVFPEGCVQRVYMWAGGDILCRATTHLSVECTPFTGCSRGSGYQEGSI